LELGPKTEIEQHLGVGPKTDTNDEKTWLPGCARKVGRRSVKQGALSYVRPSDFHVVGLIYPDEYLSAS
jgi:hypothetical protein